MVLGKIDLMSKKKYLIVFGLVAVIILGLVFFQNNFLGHVVLELDADYVEGEILDGVLRLSLSEGEFIPASTVVVFESSGQREEFVLEDVISEEVVEGVYYIQNKDFSGDGTGYGVAGSREVYPEVSFEFIVSSESEESPLDSEHQTEQAEVEEVEEVEFVEEAEVEEVEEEVEEVEEETEEAEEAEVEEDSPLDSEHQTGQAEVVSVITGNVVLGLEESVFGKVSKDNPFVYDLEEGQSARLVLGSVTVGSEVVGNDVVDFRIVDGSVLVSSDYSEVEEGFGKEYLSDEVMVFEIDLSKIGLNFSAGELGISFVYENESIVSLSTVLEEGEVLESNETILEEVVEVPSGNLTEEERRVIVEEFGSVSVETTTAEIMGGRLIRNYKIGDYELVASYDYEGSVTDSLVAEMERDRLNFLRDLVEMISRKDAVSEDVVELLN